jgi:uncharacterized protein Yka (UPF0111/DUF47 family)
MKRRILVSFIILLVVAPQLFAASDRCEKNLQKLDSAVEKMDRYCYVSYNEKNCERYSKKVEQLEQKADKFCVPNQPF